MHSEALSALLIFGLYLMTFVIAFTPLIIATLVFVFSEEDTFLFTGDLESKRKTLRSAALGSLLAMLGFGIGISVFLFWT